MLLHEPPVENAQPATCVAAVRHSLDEALEHAQVFFARTLLAIGVVPDTRAIGVNAANAFNIATLDRVEELRGQLMDIVARHFSVPCVSMRSNRMTASPL